MDSSKLRVTKPCSADWSEMTGTERERHCASCAKSVHNLTEMTEAEATELMARVGKRPCVRYLPDENGAPIFRGSATWTKLVAAGAILSVSAAGCESKPVTPELPPPGRIDYTVGKIQAPYVAGGLPEIEPVMGDVVAQPEQRMGK